MSVSKGEAPAPKEKAKTSQNLGLYQVFPNPTDEVATAQKTVDIIAIHGLNTQSPGTWEAWKDNDPELGSVNWLKDEHMLPKRLPNCRILTYDWNAKLGEGAAVQTLFGHSKTLLRRLRVQRSEERRNRPIVFVASCFGGLLLAKALRSASSAWEEYKEIYDATVGVLFLGTPFQGTSDGFQSAAFLQALVAVSSSDDNGDLVKYLLGRVNQRSELDELVTDFSFMINQDDFRKQVVCFYETDKSNISTLIAKLPEGARKLHRGGVEGVLVPESSACLHGKRRIALNVKHAMLNKYDGPKGDSFIDVCFELEELVKKAEQYSQKKG